MWQLKLTNFSLGTIVVKSMNLITQVNWFLVTVERLMAFSFLI